MKKIVIGVLGLSLCFGAVTIFKNHAAESKKESYVKGDSSGIHQDEIKKTIKKWDQVIVKHPEFANAYYWRGRAKSELKEWKGALEDLNKAITLDPKHAYAYEQRGRVKAILQDPAGAKEDQERSIELAPQIPSFSADTEYYSIDSMGSSFPAFETKGSVGKIYTTKEKLRRGEGNEMAIIRNDKGLIWALVLNKKRYIENYYGAPGEIYFSETLPSDKKTFLGKEMMEGKMANKYRLSSLSNGAEYGSRYQWVDASTGIHIKTRGEKGAWTVTYKNIKVSEQPDSLFEIPAGYKKVENPQELYL